ncbi:MAG: TVP38/TMEM64 family protein [Thermodesulfobacteriota bacterium]|jgi:uncharacterized membrane protein YdjX (TVP38/TMEM64 family)
MWRPVLLISLIVTIFVLAIVLGIGEKLGALRGWIQSLGVLGPAVFVGLYILGVVAGIPGSALTIAAGGLFGSSLGIILVSLASTLGASLAFLIARYFARDAIANWLSRREKFKSLDVMTEEHGAMIVAITRLVPIFPFNLLNYGFGLTKIPFWTYVFWSWLCMLPGTVLYVVGVDAVIQLIVQRKMPWTLLGVIAGVGVLLAVLVKFARRKMKDKGEGD